MKSFLVCIFLVVFILFTHACGDNAPPQAPPLTLKMDVPQPKRLQQSPLLAKTVPEIKKSDKVFSLDELDSENELVSSPIKDKESCFSEIEKVAGLKNVIQKKGGLWGGMEQKTDFKQFSPIGMQIDSRLNSLIHAIRHLCESAEGLTYSSLATFIDDQLKRKDEKTLRMELIKMGEPPEDVDIYLEYGKKAKEANNRKIDYVEIQKSLLKVERLAMHYETFFERIAANDEPPEKVVPDLLAFKERIDQFMQNDTQIKIAIKEDFEKPFWENRGEM